MLFRSIFGALTEGNRLKGVNNDDRPLNVRNRIVTYGPYNLFGRVRILTLACPSRPKRTTFLGEHLRGSYYQSSAGLATSTSSGASLTSELGVASSLMVGG